jgi:putative transposase
MREAYHAYVVSMLVKAKPVYITIEKLNVKGMMRNRHLSRAVANQGFYSFKQKVLNACRKYEIDSENSIPSILPVKCVVTVVM